MSNSSPFFPVCPIRGSVIFPNTRQNIDAGRAISIKAIDASIAGDRDIILLTQKEMKVELPKPEDLYDIGVLCKIVRTRKNPDGSIHLTVEAIKRVKAIDMKMNGDFIEARIRQPRMQKEDSQALKPLENEIKEKIAKLISGNRLSAEAANGMDSTTTLSELIEHLAFHIDIGTKEKQAILSSNTTEERGFLLLQAIEQELEQIQLQIKIRSQVKENIDRNQKEYYLREQIKVISQELRGDDEKDEVDILREKVEALGLAPEVKKEIDRELDRLDRTSSESHEATVIRNYLNLVIELPWNKRSKESIDLEKAFDILERDHYGLEKVKERVLEFLAVRKLLKERAEQEKKLKGQSGEKSTKARKVKEVDSLSIIEDPFSTDHEDKESGEDNNNRSEEYSLHQKGSILIFTGPPGVGKTSIAKSIAESLGRKYIRIALGGVHDESDIRGHRRTYVAAMPGRIIQALRTAGTKNPVILLDEIDKLGKSVQGDPGAALLEVLDPAQNKNFTDHYLGVPFDLSEVMFIATANYPENIPPALNDRLEEIEFSSYIEDEKKEIAKRYLIPKQIEENGLKSNQVSITENALIKLISYYTKEAGVRNLERELSKVFRKVAYNVALGKYKRIKITETDLEQYLGQVKYIPEAENAADLVGVSTGMFYTPVGGDILFIETSISEGKGFVLTGKLGDVMKESARAALSYAKINAKRFNIKQDLDNSEVHIHVPAGAIPKEGPSAGGAILSSLISALSGIPVRHDVAMTGEMTLTGRYLAIGGLKEKVLGAKRAGIKHIILPKANERDIEDIPLHLRTGLTFHPCATIDEVLDVALVGGLEALQQSKQSGQTKQPKQSKAPARKTSPKKSAGKPSSKSPSKSSSQPSN